MQWRYAKDLHDESKLLHLTFSREDRDSSEELNQNAAKAPHVDACGVRNPDDDLWSSVEARLDVRVDPLV